MHTYTDPTGQQHDAIPQTWTHYGKVHAFAGDWSRAKRAGWTRDPVDAEAAEAASLAAQHPALPAEVRAAFASLHALAALGVVFPGDGIPGWPEIAEAVGDAIAAAPDFETLRALAAEEKRGHGHWLAVVTWCGGYATAYKLAPHLAGIGEGE